MDVVVGHAILFEQPVPEHRLGDHLAGPPVPEPGPLGQEGPGTQRILQSEVVQHPGAVGRQLNTGTHLAELGRLLEHSHPETPVGERQGRGDAADAATGHQHLQIIHPDFPLIAPSILQAYKSRMAVANSPCRPSKARFSSVPARRS
jgi:hypothetical protein